MRASRSTFSPPLGIMSLIQTSYVVVVVVVVVCVHV